VWFLGNWVSGGGVQYGFLANGGSSVFGTPILLPGNIAAEPTAVPPPPPVRPSPPPVALHLSPQGDQAPLERMRCLMRAEARMLDALRASQLAVQEASGVMASAMLPQQGTMQEVTIWESEVEAVMREMARRVDGEGSNL